ncbi:hypothetical protein V6N13_037493 [Hibiscus sabdariffa]
MDPPSPALVVEDTVQIDNDDTEEDDEDESREVPPSPPVPAPATPPTPRRGIKRRVGVSLPMRSFDLSVLHNKRAMKMFDPMRLKWNNP